MTSPNTNDGFPVSENVDELVVHQKELLQEEEFLKNSLLKIEKQIHALQIERMHLINSTNESSAEEKDMLMQQIELRAFDAESKQSANAQENEECNSRVNLDLNIAQSYGYEEEEDDEEDNEEDDDML